MQGLLMLRPTFYGGQVVAITVFFLLSVAYYAFFAPFLGTELYEYVAIGVYSVLVRTIKAYFFFFFSNKPSLVFPLSVILTFELEFQAFCVFILYVRCTGIDPADPGILIEPDKISAYKLQNDTDLPGKYSDNSQIRVLSAESGRIHHFDVLSILGY